MECLNNDATNYQIVGGELSSRGCERLSRGGERLSRGGERLSSLEVSGCSQGTSLQLSRRGDRLLLRLVAFAFGDKLRDRDRSGVQPMFGSSKTQKEK